MLAINHTQSRTVHHPERHKNRPLVSHMTESFHTKVIKNPYKLPNTKHLQLESEIGRIEQVPSFRGQRGSHWKKNFLDVAETPKG